MEILIEKNASKKQIKKRRRGEPLVRKEFAKGKNYERAPTGAGVVAVVVVRGVITVFAFLRF
jgi:hypothetical protein